MAGSDLATFLAGVAPFDALDDAELTTAVAAARTEDLGPGDVVTTGLVPATSSVYVVVHGEVDVWHDVERSAGPADERLGAGGVFSTAAVLAGPSLGPHAVAAGEATVAAIPVTLVASAFASRRGAAFLAEHVSSAQRRPVVGPRYTLVDELIVRPPLVVDGSATAAEVAARMTAGDVGYAAVPLAGGGFGLVTDDLLRRRLIVDGLPASTPVHVLATEPSPTTVIGDSAAEALILMLDSDAEFLLVTDRAGEVRGAVTPRDFVVSPATAGVALHEQLRRAATTEDLVARAAGVPALLGDLLARGMTSEKVIAVHSAMIDTVVRRSITLVFARLPALSVDAFTWLSLGSNGRREAVPSSDVDSAVVFAAGLDDEETAAYRRAFGEVHDVLAAAGFSVDEHGASARRAAFSRTDEQWRAAGRRWLSNPEEDLGVIMTSLLVDGRPIHGDPGLPAVARVFGDLREHPGTMRMLLEESLSHRSRVRSMRDVFGRRVESFDIKTNAVLPVVNIARWVGLSVGTADLSTTHRLRAAAGSAMLPDDQAETLVEVFGVLQRLRLRYQLLQRRQGQPVSDVLAMAEVSPIDRSIIAQAVREIAATQRRMTNVSAYVPTGMWSAPSG